MLTSSSLSRPRRAIRQLIVVLIILAGGAYLLGGTRRSLDPTSSHASDQPLCNCGDNSDNGANHVEATRGVSRSSTSGSQPRCGMCDVAPEQCTEPGGRDRLNRAISYSGTNRRLRRVLGKMQAGEPWVMGVIGGSVSFGQGSPYGDANRDPPWNPRYRKTNMHRTIFDHLDARFPSSDPGVAEALAHAERARTKHQADADVVDLAALVGNITQDASENIIPRPFSRAYGFSARLRGVNSLINGAQGATGSNYFSYCFREHIPEDVDLVIVEMAINDEVNFDFLDHYERLIRGLLELPNRPAIIYVETMALRFATMYRGGDIEKGINEYYDIPTISARNAFIHDILADPDIIYKYFPWGWFDDPTRSIDLRHISAYTHVRVGQIVGAYIDTQICAMNAEKEAGESDYEAELSPVPRLRLNGRWDWDPQARQPLIDPICYSATAVRNKLVPSANDRWTPLDWQEKKWWTANETGSTVSFDITIKADSITLMYLRSNRLDLGSVACWVEGQVDASGESQERTILDGAWGYNASIIQFDDVRPGPRTITCELLAMPDAPEGKEFRISGVASA